MSYDNSFSKILEQTISRETTTDVDIDYESSSESDYSYMSWILGQTPRTVNPKGFKNTLYKQYQSKIQSKTHSNIQSNIRLHPSHKMNAEQKDAYLTICYYVCGFKDNFSAQDLKQAFRLAALETHPDQGGSAIAFIKVQKAYQCLQTISNV